MNIGFFGGRLGRDVELKQLDRGDTVGNFPLAVEIGTKADPKTMWVDCSIWGKRADALAPYLIKGSKVTVSGRIVLETYNKKTGETGYRLHCNVNDVDLHGGCERSTTAAVPPAAPAAARSDRAGPGRDLDDDIPF